MVNKNTHKNAVFWNNVQGREEIMSCLRKVKRTKAEAVSYAKKHGLYWYKCKFCGKYHITKLPNDSTKKSIWDIIKPLIIAIKIGEQD